MFDFQSAFLNGQLNGVKEVFMEQLPGYEESNLQKYGVKCTSHSVDLNKLDANGMCCMLTELGFKKCEATQAVFYIYASENILILAIHVDDCTMTGSSDDLIQNYKLKITSQNTT